MSNDGFLTLTQRCNLSSGAFFFYYYWVSTISVAAYFHHLWSPQAAPQPNDRKTVACKPTALMHKERKIGNYNHNAPKWLLAPDKEIFWFLTVTLICSCSSIYMWSAFPFQLFDYFVKEVIVRPPLISSNYSGGHARGPFKEGFTDLFHSSRQEVNMIWILIHLCSRRQINAYSPHCLCAYVRACVWSFLKWCFVVVVAFGSQRLLDP